MRSKIGTAQWESDLAEQIESLRSGIQNLSSTVERIAKEQIPRARVMRRVLEPTRSSGRS
jgi:hypothetical protein